MRPSGRFPRLAGQRRVYLGGPNPSSGEAMAYQQSPMAPGMEPPEAQTIKSMLHIARILAIIFGILVLLGGIAYIALIAYWASICNSYGGGALTHTAVAPPSAPASTRFGS